MPPEITFIDGYSHFECNGIAYDQNRGTGAVWDLPNLEYLGILALIRPDTFLTLCPLPPGDAADKMVSLVDAGRTLATPFLNIAVDGTLDRITEHEGRHRMKAIQRIHGDVEVPVALFFGGGVRARHLDADNILRISSGLVTEEEFGKQFVPGPIFERAYHCGVSLDLNELAFGSQNRNPFMTV